MTIEYKCDGCEGGDGSGVLVMPSFVCTDCHISFLSEDNRHAACPQCGEVYGHGRTRLIRGASFALAYWCEAHPDVQIKPYKGS